MKDTMRAVPESVLAETLKQLDERFSNDGYESMGECMECGEYPQYVDRQEQPIAHKPDCRYVLVADALRKAMGE